MSSTLYFVITSFFYCIDVFAYYRLLHNKLSYRFSQRALLPTYFVSCTLMLLISFSNMLSTTYSLKAPFFFLYFVSLFIFFNGTFSKKMLWIIVVFFSIIVCELLCMPFLLMVAQTNLNNTISNHFTQVIGLLFSRSLLLAIIELLLRSPKKIYNTFIKDFFLIILIDVTYAFILINFFYFNNIYLTIDIAIILSLLVMFIISFLALYLLRKITKKSDEIMTTNLKLQQIEMEHKQNQDMTIVVEDLRSLRHDMNNHMGILQGLLSAQAYDDANAYLATITKELSVANSFTFTENKVLSVLLNNKSSKARQRNITLDTEILNSTTPFSDRDLCAVIGNILENAIEASSNHEKPYIYFSMCTQKTGTGKHLIIQCDNTYSVAPIFENGNLITTKENKAYHGIGTKTIRSIVENYNGTVVFTADEMFHVTISVPL